MAQYSAWFLKAASLCLRSADTCIFYQTDRKAESRWVSKAHLLLNAIQAENRILVWHKLLLRRRPDSSDLFRPTYSHVIAAHKTAGQGHYKFPDVVQGDTYAYEDGMAVNITKHIVNWAKGLLGNNITILDPFCGRGTVLAVANLLGCDSLGVDISPGQCDYARKMVITNGN